ncbi:disulfide bond formation protein B [Shigella flexneri]
MNWFKLRTLCILQGNDYVAIFEPMFTRPGRVAVDGVYCSGTGTDGAVVQHVMLLKPCVLCIHERCALFGVLGAALIGAIAPKTPLRYVAMVIWLYSAFRGVQLTYEHTMLQLDPSPFATCILWFVSRNGCRWINGCRKRCRLWRLRQRQWDFLGMEMPQRLLGILSLT